MPLQPNADPKAAEDQLLVQLDGHALRSSQPAILSVAFPKDGQGTAELSLALADKISLVLRAPYASLPTLGAQIIDGPMPDGQAAANLVLNGENISSGFVKLSIAHGRINGGVDNLNLTFNGNVAIGCAVSPAHIDSEVQAPQPVDGDAEVLVDDAKFETQECAAVKAALF